MNLTIYESSLIIVLVLLKTCPKDWGIYIVSKKSKLNNSGGERKGFGSLLTKAK